MLGGAGTKKLNSLKFTENARQEKASSTQYLRWRCHEKALYTENARQDWYKKISFNSKSEVGLARENLFY